MWAIIVHSRLLTNTNASIPCLVNNLSGKSSLSMKKHVAVLMGAAALCATAQAALVIENPGFESPGAYSKSFDGNTVASTSYPDVPGWSSVIADGQGEDSGVETVSYAVGSYVGFIQPNDAMVYTYFGGGYTAAGGESIQIDFLGTPVFDTSTPTLSFSLVWNDGGNPTAFGAVQGVEMTYVDGLGADPELQAYSVLLTVPESGDFVGQSIGFAMVNGPGSIQWVRVDEFTADVVPEPAAFAAIGGLFALGFVYIKRRRQA